MRGTVVVLAKLRAMKGRPGWLAGLAAAAVLLLPVAGAAQANPSDFTFAQRYDAARRVTGTIAPDPDGAGPLRYQAVRNSYDAAGRLIGVETGQLQDWQPEGVAPARWPGFTVFTRVETSCDAMDRKLVDVASGGGTPQTVTQYSYDSQGLLECTAVRMNPAAFAALPASACTLGTQGSFGPDRITRNVYDAAGQLVTVQKAYGTNLQQDYARYQYTANGKRKAVVDANGNRAELGYDGFDRQDRWTFPSKTAVGQVDGTDYEAYGHDASGNRTSLRKRDGRSIVFAYDALNRVTAKTYPQGGARGVHYGYDLRGLQLHARFDSASGEGIGFSYDGFGNRTGETSTMGGVRRTLTSGYDADGSRTRVTWPDGQYVSYHREGLDRLYYADLNGTTPLYYPPYDAAGRTANIYRWTGGWGIPTTLGYDGVGRLASQAHAPAGGAVTAAFTYNPASQIISRSRDNDAYAWNGYVNVNRSYATNGLNQYASAGPVTFAYDANGNLTGDGANGFSYDVENRLVATSSGASLGYDPLGRLWELSKAGLTTRFLYDGDQLSAEYDAAGTLLRRYVHGDGEDDPLVWYEGSGTGSPRYLYADHQGSIVAIADAGGTVATINAYDDYGIPKSTNAGRFQYTGQAWLAELGMYHYKARIYSPTLGRFLQTDPIGYDDQINLYAYVGNDPVNHTDPTGMWIDTIADIAFIAADAVDIYRNGLNSTNGISLGANIVGAIIPGATGLGAATRAASAADRGADAAKVSTLRPGRTPENQYLLSQAVQPLLSSVKSTGLATETAAILVVAATPDGKAGNGQAITNRRTDETLLASLNAFIRTVQVVARAKVRRLEMLIVGHLRPRHLPNHAVVLRTKNEGEARSLVGTSRNVHLRSLR